MQSPLWDITARDHRRAYPLGLGCPRQRSPGPLLHAVRKAEDAGPAARSHFLSDLGLGTETVMRLTIEAAAPEEAAIGRPHDVYVHAQPVTEAPNTARDNRRDGGAPSRAVVAAPTDPSADTLRDREGKGKRPRCVRGDRHRCLFIAASIRLSLTSEMLIVTAHTVMPGELYRCGRPLCQADFST